MEFVLRRRSKYLNAINTVRLVYYCYVKPQRLFLSGLDRGNQRHLPIVHFLRRAAVERYGPALNLALQTRSQAHQKYLVYTPKHTNFVNP